MGGKLQQILPEDPEHKWWLSSSSEPLPPCGHLGEVPGRGGLPASEAWVQALALPLTGSVTWASQLTPWSLTQFLHL